MEIPTSVRVATAQPALRHAIAHHQQLSDVLSQACGATDGVYLIQAGFDHDLIHCGRFFQQIYLTVNFELAIDPAEILPQLGRVLAPFSGVICTPTTIHFVPLFTREGKGLPHTWKSLTNDNIYWQDANGPLPLTLSGSNQSVGGAEIIGSGDGGCAGDGQSSGGGGKGKGKEPSRGSHGDRGSSGDGGGDGGPSGGQPGGPLHDRDDPGSRSTHSTPYLYFPLASNFRLCWNDNSSQTFTTASALSVMVYIFSLPPIIDN